MSDNFDIFDEVQFEKLLAHLSIFTNGISSSYISTEIPAESHDHLKAASNFQHIMACFTNERWDQIVLADCPQVMQLSNCEVSFGNGGLRVCYLERWSCTLVGVHWSSTRRNIRRHTWRRVGIV